uniref:Uncharacterized protein n=1 Tax=Desulfatirhabdium butyrativorans TaxID=340467 RepID=A0A7C4RJ03_9BACT
MKYRALWITMVVGMFMVAIGWSGMAHSYGIEEIGYNVLDFDSEEDAIRWLQQYANENGLSLDDLFNMSQDATGTFEGCKNTTITPSSITTTVPKSIQIIQIYIKVTIGDCGNVLCSTMGFGITWKTAPSTGAMIFGPSPSQTQDQICVGNSITSKGMLLLQKTVPKGKYMLSIKVGGFGSADYWDLPVTIN